MRLRILIMVMLTGLAASSVQAESRLKDMGSLAGADGVNLLGYSLIIGLDRTGDTQKSIFTNQSLVNMLERFGIAVDGAKVRSRNVAAVMVTADIPPFSRKGGKFDVTVSSIGDSKSLQGGVLLQTPLTDLAGNNWGIASGPITIGGFNVETRQYSFRQNHPTVGRIPNGFTLDHNISDGMDDWTTVTYMLRNGDFTTANRVADAVNEHFQAEIARALDPVSIEIGIPDTFSVSGNSVRFVAELENIAFEPDATARVVMNERTGTIVIGSRVGISTVAISHGSLLITIKGTPQVSQPGAFSGGQTVVTQVQEVTVEQQGTGVVTIPGATTVGDVAAALNRLGVSPRDMIAIFQALSQSGSLQAELVII